jgi:hypothetical protein
MKFLYDKKGVCHLVFPPEEKEITIEVLLFLHDTGRLDLETVQTCMHYIKYAGMEVPNNLVFFPRSSNE